VELLTKGMPMARTKGKQVYLCPGYMAQHIETLRDGRVLLTAEREAISAVPLAVAAAVPLEMLKIVSIVLSGGTVSTEEKIQAHTWVRELVGVLCRPKQEL